MAGDRASLTKVVSDQIRGQILDGKLRPGERLVEDRLSIELGVSRVPVQFIQMIPYVLTLVVLAGFIGRSRPPRALGIPYETK